MEPGLSKDAITELLNEAKMRARIICHDQTFLEREEEYRDRKVSDDKKYVVEVWVETVRTKHTLVREFDPKANYQDSLEEFINPKEGEE